MRRRCRGAAASGEGERGSGVGTGVAVYGTSALAGGAPELPSTKQPLLLCRGVKWTGSGFVVPSSSVCVGRCRWQKQWKTVQRTGS